MTSPSPEALEHLIHVDPPQAPPDPLSSGMMRSAAQPDEDYELLSKSMCETSDDEAHTESLASAGDTPDDLSSLSDDDEFNDDEQEQEDETEDEDADNVAESQQHASPSESAIESLSSQHTGSPVDSIMTSMGTHDGEAYLPLQEIPSEEIPSTEADDDTVNVYRIENEYKTTSGMPDVLHGYGSSEIRTSVHMTLSKSMLPIYRSFRVLYVGNLPIWAVHDVNNHIGAALSATPSSSRFNIVQSIELPGSPSSSRVQLERSGCELVVDHCKDPDVVRDDGVSSAKVTLNDGSQIIFSEKGTIRPSTAPLPDLVIFGYGTEPSCGTTASMFRDARNIIRQHNIPSLDIAVVRLWDIASRIYAFDANSLRLCVDGRRHHDAAFTRHRTLPIDLYSFLSIEPSQLNRHLAYLHEHPAKARPTHESATSNGLYFTRSYAKATKAVNEAWAQRRKHILLINALITLVMVYLAQSALFPVLGPKMEVLPHAANSTSIAVSPPAPLLAVTTPSSAASPSFDAQVISTPKCCAALPSVEKARGSWMDRSVLSKEKPAPKFAIEVASHDRFILSPSKHGDPSKCQVQVHRDREAVPVQVTISDGGILVCLKREYSVGMFNVSIWAGRKLQQSFEIKLGSNKSTLSTVLQSVDRLSKGINLADVGKVVKHELAAAQAGAKSLSTQMSKALQAGAVRVEDSALAALGQTKHWKHQLQGSKQTVAEHLKEATKGARHWKRQLKESKQTVGEKLRRVKKEAKHKLMVTKDVSKTFRDSWQLCTSLASGVSQGLKSDVTKRTRPLRTSNGMLRMRDRALGMRCNLEKKLGKEGTKTCKRWEGARQH